MKRVTKKQLEVAKKNYKSNYKIAPKVESIVRDLNNEPIFVETICNALDIYRYIRFNSTEFLVWKYKI